jgi:predicted CoA-binding protein
LIKERQNGKGFNVTDDNSYTDEDRNVIDTLNKVKTIALIGASATPTRDSYKVMAFLLSKGYQVFPINPLLAGQELMGRKVYSCINEIPIPIDMLDVFRQSKYLYDIVVEAKQANITQIWTQLGVTDLKAEELALVNNINMIVSRCPMIEIPRLGL